MLDSFPTLAQVTRSIDASLRENHAAFFGPNPQHPFSKLKGYKVVHDHLWGTTKFSWRELVLMDSPVMQRLRRIHQTGLAFYVYPSARHSRFEHSLGVLTVASKVFDSLEQNAASELGSIISAVFAGSDPRRVLSRLRQELRLAALLHDTGHSLFSHASERVYSNLALLQRASVELTQFSGKKKGVGEVLSFCLALTPAVRELLKRAESRLQQGVKTDQEEFGQPIDLTNVAMMIIGRSCHPYLQFLGDIISSGFDADKLDYLLRDAIAAGLPLRYDLERYLYTVYLQKGELSDEEQKLERMYELVGWKPKAERRPSRDKRGYPYYDAYRLRLPRLAMSTIEQIIICKLMLYTYIYHHPKVLSAEGMLVRLLTLNVEEWKLAGETDERIMLRFLAMADSAVDSSTLDSSKSPLIADYNYRVQNRLLPRVVFSIGGAISHAEGDLVRSFMTSLQDKDKRASVIEGFETAMGRGILQLRPGFGKDPREALHRAGAWLDVPKTPDFEDADAILGKPPATVSIDRVFPIGHWTEAYKAHRYFVRVFAFSEYVDIVDQAAQDAISRADWGQQQRILRLYSQNTEQLIRSVNLNYLEPSS
jgi:HD superfamily phosphohydrolase